MTVITFDTHSAVKRLTQKGVQEEQAEEFVKIFTEIKSIDFDNVASKEQVAVLEKDFESFIKHVATKADLEKVRTDLEKVRTDVEKVRTEFHQSEKRLMLIIGGAVSAAVVAICSAVAVAVQYLLLHLA